MKVSGFNHLTLKVRNLEDSVNFYTSILGLKLIHQGKNDVYLEWGSAWICLISLAGTEVKAEESTGESVQGPQRPEALKSAGIDHIAFTIAEEDFAEAVQVLRTHNVPIVRGPLQRGQGWSVNFLDPDNVELELHTSNLEERMQVWQ